MPIYVRNMEDKDYLIRSVKSIFGQTYANLEILLINDKSPFDISDLLKDFSQDTRVRVMENNVNQGIAQTHNIGIQEARGSYIANMDQDDVSLPTRLEKQYEFLINHPNYAAVGAQVEVIDEKSTVVGKRIYPQSYDEIIKDISVKSPLCNPAVLLTKEALLKTGLYKTDVSMCEDYAKWFELIDAGYKIANLSETLFQYRVSKTQEKSNKVKALLYRTQKVQQRWIFKSKFFSAKAFMLWTARWLVMLLPANWILRIFKLIFIYSSPSQKVSLENPNY